MAYRLHQLEPIINEMEANEITKCIFTVQYNAHPFSCIFTIKPIPLYLYITSVGEAPFCIEREIGRDFTISTMLSNEEYHNLVRYLNLHYNKSNPFRPVAFFQSLDGQMNNINFAEARYSDFLRVVRLNRTVEEADKIYFCGWRNNPQGYHVSQRNLEKTRLAFGDKIADKSRKLNLSSCWTNNEDEENLAKLNDFIAASAQQSNLQSKN